jgi:hypothetical protein
MFAKRTTVVTIFLLAALAAGSTGATPHSYPRVANFYTTDPRLDDCPRLSEYDLVVLPGGMQDISPEIITTLRSLNPDIVILAYFPASLMWPEEAITCETGRQFWDKVVACDWWLYDTKGYKMGDPEYLWVLNFTTNCPEDPYGQTLGEWLASYIADRIYATGLWDGILIDGCFENPTWLNNTDKFFQHPPAMVDSDRNGVGDNDEDLEQWWLTALTGFVSSLRSQVGPGATMVGNGKQFMHGLLNGGIRENFPNMHGDWDANMFSEYGYLTNCDQFLSSPLTASMILCYDEYEGHTVFTPYRSSSYLKFMRFTLTSALLGDGYYVLEGISGRCLWWEDLYDVDLGAPTSDAYLDSVYSQSGDRMCPVWRRDFQNGYVLCNPFNQYIYTVDNDWIMYEDGLIKITHSDVPFTVRASREDIPRVVDRDVRRLRIPTAVANPSEHAAPAFVWSVTRLGDEVLNTGPVLERLVGKSSSDTLEVTVGFPSTLGFETYTIDINVAGPDMEILHTDRFRIRRTVQFPSDETTEFDNHDPGSDTIQEDGLLIYPQPAAFSSGETLRMEVRGNQTSANEICTIRMFDVRGRLVRSIYEGVYGEGLNLEIGLTNKGGEKIAPGLYIIVLEMGNLAQNRKIVLLK